jgi:hypothetical protein
MARTIAEPVRFGLMLLTCAAALPAQETPRRYEAVRAERPPAIDGKLDDAVWLRAKWTEDFVYITGEGEKPQFRTRVKMLWDDRAMYFAAELEEPHVWATLREHDSVIFHDNDFEVFLNPTGDTLNYFELELNAFNTTWDLFLPKPYKKGGKADNGLELIGLKTAVHIDGTINDPRDTDKGWTVEIEIPWGAYASRYPIERPKAGEEWRVNFSRVQWPVRIVDGKYEKTTPKPLDWVWSPQGVVDMHIPERWGYVKFVE